MKVDPAVRLQTVLAIHDGAIRLMIADPGLKPEAAAERSTEVYNESDRAFYLLMDRVVEIPQP